MTLEPPLLVLAAGRKPRPRRAARFRPRESKLHVDVANTLRDHVLPDWDWRFLNSKAKDAREGAILKRMGVKPFWPDFILVSPHGSVRYLELKREGEAQSDGQHEFRIRNVRRGIPHVVAWNIDQVLAALDEWRCVRFELPERREAE